MTRNIEDLDFDDEELDNLESLELDLKQEKSWMSPEENNEKENPLENLDSNEISNSEEDDLITYILKNKGIKDPEKIKFEDEDGEILEVSWNSLSREEQINILKPEDNNNKVDETSLDESEINFINKLRKNKLTPDEYENYLIQQGKQQQKENQEPMYLIDDIEDDELFVLDLQARFENITDEEAVEALNRAKTDEALYKKQIEGIREEYKRIEDDKNKRDLFEKELLLKEQFEAFSNQILESIHNFNSIGDLDIDLDSDDKEDIAQFLLTADGAGINYFSKALNDPNTLVKMAWFTLKGEEAFNNITKYFTNEIKQRELASYQKGLNDAKLSKSSTNKVVYQPKQNINNKTNQKLYITINDLD